MRAATRAPTLTLRHPRQWHFVRQGAWAPYKGRLRGFMTIWLMASSLLVTMEEHWEYIREANQNDALHKAGCVEVGLAQA